ncbi:MAG: DNA gyrase inhibitor YacG [Planctomycetes bacterium]|jgi:endogenous inhibitor of DNA gyrase (YacG/DUF329 family)|nr:DNA gyrase inhibitor YacG [Planctomycetota bacterium]MCL4730332.1 DNA gyrase inhibitor YacG [Planctomycetota bacterium]
MPRPRQRKCPQCRRAFRAAGLADRPSFPFCSDKCKLLDLGVWLNNGYAVVEDLARGQDLKNQPEIAAASDDPDVRAALDELESG